MAEIFLAGGCFWGTEHYFKNIRGVTATEAGYANGEGTEGRPSYEQVYTDTTGFAETVRVAYDPSILPLGELLEAYFCAIDPLSLNRQGEDRGTRYRTGIYYSDTADIPEIQRVFAKQEEAFGRPLAVETGPLKNFFPAEERHQDYLDKNPGGYCHLSPKLFRYPKAVEELESLLDGETDLTARLSNTAALIKERLGFFWVGFYLVRPAAGGGGTSPAGDELVLGPFQGPIACMRIRYGRGVCGTAWKERKTVIVPDVDEFPGHIACSSLSRSEIVVPIFDRSRTAAVIGVLDIDSTETDTFDHADAYWLGRMVDILAKEV